MHQAYQFVTNYLPTLRPQFVTYLPTLQMEQLIFCSIASNANDIADYYNTGTCRHVDIHSYTLTVWHSLLIDWSVNNLSNNSKQTNKQKICK